MPPAIRVENLGKKYRIDHATPRGRFRYRTLRESLTEAVQAPLRRWRQGPAESQAEDFWALREVGFEIEPGALVGIIGRNGAGKSTLLKILSRISKPTTGRVELHGRVGSLLEVGTGFHPELTGRENIYLNGSILGMRKAEIDRKFDEIVAFAEIERFLDTPVKRYSSGMYVRLAFSVAAHLEPEILLVDEVLAVGDAEFQKKCLWKMGEIGREGRTVLFVSHNMNAVAKLTNSTMLVDHGKMAAFGETAKIISKYISSGTQVEPRWRRDVPVEEGRVLTFTGISASKVPGQAESYFNADEAFYIEIEFVVREAVDAQIAFRLNTNNDGTTIFTSALSDQEDMSCTRFSPGTYRSFCKIPPYLLTPGRYHLLVAANNPRGSGFDLIEQVLELEVTCIGSLTRFDRRLGYITPLLEWNLDRL
jgi:lipopolysaccharide transport system ATP-binding protein